MKKTSELKNIDIELKAIKDWLESGTSIFLKSRIDNALHEYGPKKGKKKHNIIGYTSKVLSIYVDTHNKEVGIFTTTVGGQLQQPIPILESSKVLYKNVDVLRALVAEKQEEYSAKFENLLKRMK